MKNNTLLLFKGEYDVAFVFTLGLERDYDPKEQANLLLEILFSQVPGDVFIEFAHLIGMTPEALQNYCEANE